MNRRAFIKSTVAICTGLSLSIEQRAAVRSGVPSYSPSSLPSTSIATHTVRTTPTFKAGYSCGKQIENQYITPEYRKVIDKWQWQRHCNRQRNLPLKQKRSVK